MIAYNEQDYCMNLETKIYWALLYVVTQEDTQDEQYNTENMNWYCDS